ncbi:DUF4278 domain-containing protein [Prochlorococcus marinus]|uniref:DUF4278 domain-containing protein n=1 Tax=Prochlorococcus marinus TaxID=1219 RepID=UPI0022B3EF2C|nr:DUF4278 domain-containing protein [Prochlorococcus marinus]
METLIYRGKAYVQHKQIAQKHFVELTYRQNVYINRQEKASPLFSTLTYRGVQYQKA